VPVHGAQASTATDTVHCRDPLFGPPYCERSLLWGIQRSATSSQSSFIDGGQRFLCFYRRDVPSGGPVTAYYQLGLLCSADTQRLNQHPIAQQLLLEQGNLRADRQRWYFWAAQLAVTGIGAGCTAVLGGIAGLLPCEGLSLYLRSYFGLIDGSQLRAVLQQNLQAMNHEQIDELQRIVRGIEADAALQQSTGVSRCAGCDCPAPPALELCREYIASGGAPVDANRSPLDVACSNLGDNRIRLRVRFRPGRRDTARHARLRIGTGGADAVEQVAPSAELRDFSTELSLPGPGQHQLAIEWQGLDRDPERGTAAPLPEQRHQRALRIFAHESVRAAGGGIYSCLHARPLDPDTGAPLPETTRPGHAVAPPPGRDRPVR
jgi:hypothetical protein